MKDFQALLPPSKATKTRSPDLTMEDVRELAVAHKPYFKQCLRTLESHLGDMSLSMVPGSAKWFEETFPKPKKGIHPRPDLNQKLEPYMKWRQETLRAIHLATGEAEAKKKRSYRDDSWKQILDAIALHSTEGGILYKSAGGPVSSLADLCRSQGLEVWDLTGEEGIQRLEDAIARGYAPKRKAFRDALAFLQKYRFIDEIKDVLPEGPVIQLPTKAQKMALPDVIEQCIEDLIQKTATNRDEVVGRDSLRVAGTRLNDYRAALRHHLRTLPHCHADKRHGYTPVTKLAAVNNPLELLSIEHIKATIRHTEFLQDERDSISASTAHSYYAALRFILEKNELITPKEISIIKSSSYLKTGSRESAEMTEAVKAWCKALLDSPEKQKRLINLHRIVMAKAEQMMVDIEERGTPASTYELSKIRRYGIVSVAAAIEFTGAPLRRSNLVGLRINGPTRNFVWDSKKKTYCFSIAAEETKAKKTIERTYLRTEMKGADTVDWYLKRIRPLFPKAERSTYLLPGIQDGSKHLDKKLFGDMFQRTMAEFDMPMNFHKCRHGYVSIVLSRNWNMLAFVAAALGHTPEVCARKYAFVNKENLIAKGQDAMVKIFKEELR